jgi:carboxymethylenebutenolidase
MRSSVAVAPRVAVVLTVTTVIVGLGAGAGLGGCRAAALHRSASDAAPAAARSPEPPPSSVAAAAAPALAPTELSIPGKAGALKAYLWRPAGAGPFPAVVYNHGSEQQPVVGTLGRVGPFLARHGFVVLFPNRRGAGGSEGVYWRDRVEQLPPDQRPRGAVNALVEENDDVLSAIEWLRAQPWVAGDDIAVAGCSFGGIQSLLTGERAVPGLRTVVDFAGGAMSWQGSPLLRERLVQAAKGARVPVFFVQAENDFDTTPSSVLSETMRAGNKPYRVQIFPPFGTTHMEGHGGFCMKGTDVWGEAVLDFLKNRR